MVLYLKHKFLYYFVITADLSLKVLITLKCCFFKYCGSETEILSGAEKGKAQRFLGTEHFKPKKHAKTPARSGLVTGDLCGNA